MSILPRSAKQGFEIDRKKIDMPEPIKTVGAHEAVVKLHMDIKAVIKIEVVPENAEGKANG